MRRRNFLKKLGITAIATTAIPGIIDPFNAARAAISPGEKGIYITKMSVATFNGLNTTARIVRIDTNKGISGYGECRVEDTNAANELNICAPIVLNMNPTQVDKVFNAITEALNPTADWRTITYSSGAIAAIECACWDITGKVYNVPIWKLLGPKLNDKMRMYCDTWTENNLSTRKAEIQRRIDMGFTWFKTDLNGILTSSDYSRSRGTNPYAESGGLAKHILNSGYEKFLDYVASYREMIGDAPLSADHFFPWSPQGSGNQLDVESAIQLSNYLGEPGYLDKTLGGWMEDIIPWHYYSELAQINAGTDMHILSGEDMFGFEELRNMVNAGAINYFHPDPATFGGIHQSRLAAIWAHERGVKTALHQSNSPIAMIMCAHIAAGIPDFLSCEHHYPEISWYDDLVDGLPKPLMVDGYVQIPDGPGLGITPNDATMSAHLPWGTTTLWKQLT
ncbi:MAG: mandelate racemase/muconate lactonizing enzyme family protein [Prolixibacteraceae bacterium]|nr:mandelate racemase/muconate lactonizing enzyme family protein [Prolixibacteraceae bacterium]